MPPALYRFGAYELDVPRLELRRSGAAVHLQPKALDLLIHLVRHRERVVTRDELLSALWPDVVVTEASLSKAVSAARRALGDDGGEQAWIATVRGRGFRFVAPVSPADDAEVAGAAPPREPRSRDSPLAAAFVGREELLAVVDASLAAARNGVGRLLLLTGEAGMGKTRTAQEAASRAAAAGVRALHGWCHETEGAPGLWPWRVALRQLLDRPDARTLLRPLGAGAAELAELLGIGERSAAGDGPVLDPASARFRRFETLVEVLATASHAEPLLVVLDDFHRADPDSLALLRFALRRLPELGLVLLVAHRSESLPVGHALLELARAPQSDVLALAALSAAQVGELMRAEVGRPVDAAVASAVRDRADGNPFFVRELARALASAGGLDAPDALAGVSLPAGIRNVLHERLDQLSVACRELLALAALMGRDLDVALLARAGRISSSRVLELLDEARSGGVLLEVGDSFRFAHTLLRDELLAPVAATGRAHLHRTVAEAIESHYRDDLEPQLGRLAHHFGAGAAAGCSEQAVRYARLAGDRAVALQAHREAVDHYQRALAAQQLVAADDEASRCDLLLALGDARIASGEPEEGRAALERAADLARRTKSPERLARAALTSGGLELSSQVGVDDPALIALLTEALGAFADAPSALSVRLLTRLGEALYWSGDWERSERAIARAVTDARALGDPVALGYALYGRHWLEFVGPGLGARLESADEMLALARKASHRELELAAHSCRFLVLLQLGRGGEAHVELGRYEELARELRVPRYRWRGHCYHAALAALEGRFADVEAAVARTLAEEDLFRPGDAVGAMMLFFLHREQDRAPDVDVSDLAARLPAFTATWRAGVAVLLADAGRHDESRAALTTLVRRDFVETTRSFNRLSELVMCTDACAAVDDPELALALHGLLLPYRSRIVVIGGGFFCLGSVELFLGRLAATARRHEQAREHFAHALEANRRSGAQPWLAWTRYELSRLPDPGPGAARSAPALREEIAARARELGMGRLARLASEAG